MAHHRHIISVHAASGRAPFPATVGTHSVALAAASGSDGWVQLLPLGTFSGRDGRGPYTVPTRAAAEQVVANTMARTAGADLPIDYDHQTDFAAVRGVGGTAPAAGWIKVKTLEVRDDGIWGRAEWTPRAAQALDALEYRYISPVFEHTKSGQVVRLLRAGLTNNPNLELAAVAAALHHEDDMDFIAKLREALHLPDTTGEEAVLAHAAGLHLRSTAFSALATAAAVTPGESAETIAAASATMACRLAGYAEAARVAGLKPDDQPAQLAVAINAAITGAADPARYVPVAEVVALQSQLNDMKMNIGQEKAVAAVDAAIKTGKLIPALRDWGLALHAKAPADFDAFVAAAPVVLRSGEGGQAAAQTAGADGLTEGERAICTAMGVEPAAFLKHKPKES